MALATLTLVKATYSVPSTEEHYSQGISQQFQSEGTAALQRVAKVCSYGYHQEQYSGGV